MSTVSDLMKQVIEEVKEKRVLIDTMFINMIEQQLEITKYKKALETVCSQLCIMQHSNDTYLDSTVKNALKNATKSLEVNLHLRKALELACEYFTHKLKPEDDGSHHSIEEWIELFMRKAND